jgi:hypothetical protein
MLHRNYIMYLSARACAFLASLVLVGVFGSLQATAARFSSSSTDINPNGRIRGSKCTNQTSQIPYAGGYPYNGVFADRWASGKVYVCYTKYQLPDSDPNGDYYALEASSHWTYQEGKRSFPARMYQFIASNTKSKDNRYGSTPSFTSSKSCSQPFSIGFQVGPPLINLGVSTDQTLCNGYNVRRTDYKDNRSNWTSSQAGGLATINTTYIQKVPEGVVPLFEVHFGIPQYKHYWNNNYWETKENFYWVDYYKV